MARIQGIQHIPKWFLLGERATPQVMRRIAEAVSANAMSLQVRSSAKLAFWFTVDSLLLANKANRDGMHSNALALTRQCIEAISIVELGICGHEDAESVLLKWESDRLTQGGVRAWLQANVWPNYGSGLWIEPWSEFMREFAGAVQPYAHYGPALAQWQLRLQALPEKLQSDMGLRAIVELSPRAYDAQKATRITLFHTLLHYALGRIWMAANEPDPSFFSQINQLGQALGKSRYLDGHQTDWSQQFWAMVWDKGGSTILE